MQVLVEGVKKAGSLNAAKVAEAIRGLDLTTPLGKVQYQDNGDLRDAKNLYLPGEGRRVRPGRAIVNTSIGHDRHCKERLGSRRFVAGDNSDRSNLTSAVAARLLRAKRRPSH